MLPVKYKSRALKTRRVKSSPQDISSKKNKTFLVINGFQCLLLIGDNLALPEQPYLSTQLKRNRGLMQRNDPRLFQKCQLFIITKSSVLRRARTRHAREIGAHMPGVLPEVCSFTRAARATLLSACCLVRSEMESVGRNAEDTEH